MKERNTVGYCLYVEFGNKKVERIETESCMVVARVEDSYVLRI